MTTDFAQMARPASETALIDAQKMEGFLRESARNAYESWNRGDGGQTFRAVIDAIDQRKIKEQEKRNETGAANIVDLKDRFLEIWDEIDIQAQALFPTTVASHNPRRPFLVSEQFVERDAVPVTGTFFSGAGKFAGGMIGALKSALAIGRFAAKKFARSGRYLAVGVARKNIPLVASATKKIASKVVNGFRQFSGAGRKSLHNKTARRNLPTVGPAKLQKRKRKNPLSVDQKIGRVAVWGSLISLVAAVGAIAGYALVTQDQSSAKPLPSQAQFTIQAKKLTARIGDEVVVAKLMPAPRISDTGGAELFASSGPSATSAVAKNPLSMKIAAPSSLYVMPVSLASTEVDLAQIIDAVDLPNPSEKPIAAPAVKSASLSETTGAKHVSTAYNTDSFPPYRISIFMRDLKKARRLTLKDVARSDAAALPAPIQAAFNLVSGKIFSQGNFLDSFHNQTTSPTVRPHKHRSHRAGPHN